MQAAIPKSSNFSGLGRWSARVAGSNRMFILASEATPGDDQVQS